MGIRPFGNPSLHLLRCRLRIGCTTTGCPCCHP